jgi:hypothetical protein
VSRFPLIIRTPEDRARAKKWVDAAPVGMSITFKVNKRSIDQNALLWSRLNEVAAQVVWYGEKLSATDWKDILTASLRKARVCPGIDPGSFVVLGLHTSDMTKDEMTMLLELVAAFGAQHGVVFREPEEAAA